MGLKEDILVKLSERAGETISAKELCDGKLSRNAVWKAVRALQKEGHPVESVGGKGYRLDMAEDFPTADGISALCHGFKVEVYDALESTNTLLRSMAEGGAEHGTVIIAAKQNGGRGRMGRSFYSGGGGLYMSLLIRPTLSADKGGSITGVAAVAVAEAIEALCGKSCRIKWVNDIFCGGKKVCGILTEAAIDLESRTFRYAVIGIGLNVYAPKEGFPKELEGIAEALYPHNERSTGFINRLAAEILTRLNKLLSSPETALEGYRKRCFVIGQTVTACRGETEETFFAENVDENYCLIGTDSEGRKAVLNSGEVRVRPEGVPL